MNKIKQTISLFLAVYLVGCSQPAGVGVQSVTDVTVVEKEVKTQESDSIGSFEVKGTKDKVAKAVLNAVKYYAIDKSLSFAGEYYQAVAGVNKAQKQLKNAQAELRAKCLAGVKYPKNCPR